MLEAKKAKDLFSPNSTEKVIVSAVCKPHKGEIPKKTPKAIEKAFLLSESFVSKRSSLRNALKLFFFETSLENHEV